MAVKEKSRTGKPRFASASYLALVRVYPIHPIRDECDLDAAIAVIDGLLSRPGPLDRQEHDYLECLGHEVERYEAEAHPIPDVWGTDMLRYLIDARGATLSSVAQATGIALSTLSAILNKKGRKLNLEHVKCLAPHFGVEPAVFLERA